MTVTGHMEARVGSADVGSFWRCSVVVPYVANYEEGARAHLVPPAASARTAGSSAVRGVLSTEAPCHGHSEPKKSHFESGQ